MVIPSCNPWRSSNYDLALEWYFSPSSLVSLALFKIDIESFIEKGVVMKALPDIDGVVRREVPVNTEVDGKGGTIDGVELTYQQAFDFLPRHLEWLRLFLQLHLCAKRQCR